MAILGLGIDLVQVSRFANRLDAAPKLLEKVFGPDERAGSVRSLAGRWAAKEALAKALGAPAGLRWHDAQVLTIATGAPFIQVSGTVETHMRELGITAVQVSITHDGDYAAAVVVASGDVEGKDS